MVYEQPSPICDTGSALAPTIIISPLKRAPPSHSSDDETDCAPPTPTKRARKAADGDAMNAGAGPMLSHGPAVERLPATATTDTTCLRPGPASTTEAEENEEQPRYPGVDDHYWKYAVSETRVVRPDYVKKSLARCMQDPNSDEELKKF
ncbi:MAG: hypothetical protein M1832_005660 [Thelocarpon impressellum]|nr:MAG: hypothetical protein M1832_005660 [Thelocarpon impressellum]